MDDTEDTSLLRKVRDLYAGFPAVATSSLPQGGVFFLARKEASRSLRPCPHNSLTL